VGFMKQLADRIGDGGFAQSSQSGEPVHWRGFRGVFLDGPCTNLGNDVDACTFRARTTGKVVEVDGSTECCIMRTR